VNRRFVNPIDAAEGDRQMGKGQRVLSGAPQLAEKIPFFQILFARAQEAHRAGQFADARAGYKKVLQKRPNHFEAWHMLGVCEHQGGDDEAAVRALRRALLLDAGAALAHSDLGIAFKALQRHQEALDCFERAIALKPDFADACYNRGNLFSALGRGREAILSFDQAIAIDPLHVHAWKNRGAELQRLGRFDEAVLSFDAALAIAPDDAAAWSNRAGVLRLLARFEEALGSADRALSIDPQMPEAWLVRAGVLQTIGRASEAQAACARALAHKPDYAKAFTLLGQCRLDQGDVAGAIACFDRSLALKPDEEATLSARIFALDYAGDGDFAAQQAARGEWWRRIGAGIAAQPPLPHTNDFDPNRRIVLGYVSAEFRHRSAAYVFRPVLQNHDRSRFEVICYSGAPTEDAVTRSFRDLADRWRDVLQCSDTELDERIRADKVDILIDLSGHTEGNRLRVMARKPAPVQVCAWGHGSGTGLPTIDYLFADPVLVPAAERALFAEQIFDLPCALMVEPPPAALRSLEPPARANGHVTYGVFSRASRLSDASIGVWARILHADSTARLLIKDKLIDDAAIRRGLIEKFAAHGIAPDRIGLLGSTSRDDHLAAFRHVDICLDPIPHGGGVSVWESLYMGVPIVTRLGRGIATRTGGAILTAVDMSDWVAADDDHYVDIALRSAPDRLAAIRHALPDLIARRCSPAAYTRAVEEAYRTMWSRRCVQQHNGGNAG
jgi:predicted O-linked N-acetylglucosamine transferase (SPINDLY family)